MSRVEETGPTVETGAAAHGISMVGRHDSASPSKSQESLRRVRKCVNEYTHTNRSV